jgi:hypothetical protein
LGPNKPCAFVQYFDSCHKFADTIADTDNLGYLDWRGSEALELSRGGLHEEGQRKMLSKIGEQFGALWVVSAWHLSSYGTL